jgi:hypothetical protein
MKLVKILCTEQKLCLRRTLRDTVVEYRIVGIIDDSFNSCAVLQAVFLYLTQRYALSHKNCLKSKPCRLVQASASRSVPEFIDPVFAKTSPKRWFSVIENERFGLVFAKTGSIISGTVQDNVGQCRIELDSISIFSS